ncbi:hypothetical protein Gohar_017731 [Gossypium harknessii]|uniref:Uncharacterized protein n=1 Tax=Gossypium harknessii TaxID=34285 RepID=A0A7J9G931_9ROSI|nr:hypothetical protein [Gossypium harknessii]
MRRGRGKAKKQNVVSSLEDPGSGEDEKIPAYKRRGRPQKQMKDDIDEDEVEKVEEDGEDIKVSVLTKEIKNQAVTENGRKRKRSMQAKENIDSIKKGNGITTKSSTDDATKSVGYRQNGSRRKNKPRRAAEAVVECNKMAADPSELRYYEDDDTPTMKTIKGATTGFVAGTIWGTVVATWYDVPRVERSVAIPGLVRTLKMMGNYGMTFAAIGGVYIGVEQLLQNYRMKRDFVNGAVGGFVAGASILGFKGINFIQSASLLWPLVMLRVIYFLGRSISTAISAGSALAFTSAVIDAGGQTTRLDTGKEYYPYTTKKRPVES